jgi:hypothetical protein
MGRPGIAILLTAGSSENGLQISAADDHARHDHFRLIRCDALEHDNRRSRERPYACSVFGSWPPAFGKDRELRAAVADVVDELKGTRNAVVRDEPGDRRNIVVGLRRDTN